jgi:hypothetical protein
MRALLIAAMLVASGAAWGQAPSHPGLIGGDQSDMGWLSGEASLGGGIVTGGAVEQSCFGSGHDGPCSMDPSLAYDVGLKQGRADALPRTYTLAEIDRMRKAIYRALPVGGGLELQILAETRLQTNIILGIAPEALEAAAPK